MSGIDFGKYLNATLVTLSDAPCSFFRKWTLFKINTLGVLLKNMCIT